MDLPNQLARFLSIGLLATLSFSSAGAAFPLSSTTARWLAGPASRLQPPALPAAAADFAVHPADSLAKDPLGPERPAKPAVVRELVRQPVAPQAAVPPTPIAFTYVPVLMYHYIRVNPDPNDRLGFSLSVPPTVFSAQMDYLAAAGFHVVSLHDAVEAIRGRKALPSRPVVLTFDDGYADFYSAALPILRAHRFTATVFIVTGFVGRPGYLTWSQIRAADAMGFTIGAHTVNHVALAAQSPSRAWWEMQQSKVALEAMLGHPVLEFAYPYGSFSNGVAGQARQLGFESASSTIGGTWHSLSTLMSLARVRIGGGMSLLTFARLLGGPAPR